MTDFTIEVVDIIKNIPKGKVMTYGQIAGLAGKPRGARQVVWILSSMSEKYNLPWYRVVNRLGEVRVPTEAGKNIQKMLLEGEGIVVENNKVDLKKYSYRRTRL